MAEANNEELLKKQIEELEELVSTLKRHNELLSQEKSNNESDIEILKDFESKIQQLTREKKNILQGNEDMTKENHSLRKKIEGLEKQKTELEKENKDLKNNSFEEKYNKLRTFILESLKSYNFYSNSIQTTIKNIENALD